MTIDMDFSWSMAVYLVSLRLSVLLMFSPIFSSLSKLISVRALLTISLAALLVSGLGARPVAVPVTMGTVILASLAELWVGVTLAFGVFAAFGAFSIAGKIVDIQSGLGIGGVFDPVTRTGAPLFATMLNLLAVAVFFAMDGHHALLRGIAFSLQQIPPGMGFSTPAHEAVIRQFGLMFSLGVALMAPAMFFLFLVEVALALVSRVLPQMNVFAVGIPVKIVMSMAMLALMMHSLGQVMGRVYASIFTYWERVLH